MSKPNCSEEKDHHDSDIKPELDLSIEAFNIINEEVYDELNIRKRIKALEQSGQNLSRITSSLNPESIYILDDIKELCINNRYRFIHPRRYKEEFPNELVLKIKNIEQDLNIEMTKFKMLSTKKSFAKKKSEDVKMLFVEIDEEVYYLIHKWGKSIPKMRNKWVFPFRNVKSFFISILTLALLVAVLFPFPSANTIQDHIYLRFSVFMIMTILSTGILFFIAFTFRFSFSENDWLNEKHLN